MTKFKKIVSGTLAGCLMASALPKFHGNTSSITAKLCLVSTQNLLANHSCSIMRYCPNRQTKEAETKSQLLFSCYPPQTEQAV